MTSTHKPKPPDRGAPDSKPSRKVALNEVLRSLQDLVQNELSIESGPASSPPASPADTAPPAPEPPPLAESPAAVREENAELSAIAETMDISSTPDDARPEPQKAKSKSAGTRRSDLPKSDARGIQQELPHLDLPPESETVPAAEPEPPVAETPEALPVAEPVEIPAHIESGEIDPDASSLQEPEPPAAAANMSDLSAGELESLPDIPQGATESLEITAAPTDTSAAPEDLSEIPVLEDAVDLEPTPPAAAVGSSPLPAPEEARRLAIQAAARLNVALRKEGKPVLASDVIARLVRELEQALANHPPNVDNTRPK